MQKNVCNLPVTQGMGGGGRGLVSLSRLLEVCSASVIRNWSQQTILKTMR